VHYSYDASTLPNDEASLGRWLEARWSEKEKSLERFYAMKSDSGDGDGHKRRREFSSEAVTETPWNAMYLSLVVWTLFTFGAKYLFFTSNIAFYWVITCTFIFILVSQFTDGIQQLEIALHRHNQKQIGQVNEKNHFQHNGSSNDERIQDNSTHKTK